jgi:S-adenosylmethionine:diacylglycerol 3-amino-3-carboxypropyl transferase
MEHSEYILKLREGMAANVLVIDLPVDAEDRFTRIALAVSHLESMLLDADLAANSTEAERAVWQQAADRGRL